MKTINWNKIPESKVKEINYSLYIRLRSFTSTKFLSIFSQVLGKTNIWSLVANSHQHSPMADLDWAEMEGLFCQPGGGSSNGTNSAHGSPRLANKNSNQAGDGGANDGGERTKSRKENSEVR